MNSNQYGRLMEQASKLKSENKLDDAEKILQKLMLQAEIKEKVIVANNLATIEHARGNIEKALFLLEPLLEDDTAIESPYTFGLAAQLYAPLDRRNEAERSLNQAVKVFREDAPPLTGRGDRAPLLVRIHCSAHAGRRRPRGPPPGY